MAATSHFTILQSLAINNSFANEREREMYSSVSPRAALPQQAVCKVMQALACWPQEGMDKLRHASFGYILFWQLYLGKSPEGTFIGGHNLYPGSSRASKCSNSKGGIQTVISWPLQCSLLQRSSSFSLVQAAQWWVGLRLCSLWVLLTSVQPQRYWY